MEDDVREFLVKILNTIAMGMIWLIINMTVGIYFDFAFFENKPGPGNYIFYAWFVISLLLLIRYLIKKWKRKTDANTKS